MRHCLPGICHYVEIALEKSEGNIKEREKSALRKILSSLTDLKVPFTVFPRNLLKKILLIVISDGSDFDEYCLLFLLSLPKSEALSLFFMEAVFEIIERKTEKFRKTFKVDNVKLPMQFLFLVAYTQELLGEDRQGAYETAFWFTAHFVEGLYNKCCDNEHLKAFMTFAECYVKFLISLGNDPDWPVVPFILQLITKNLRSKLITGTNIRLQLFLIKQIPWIAKRLKGCEAEKDRGDFKPLVLKNIVTAYVATLPRDFIKGDVGRAYENLWSKYLPGVSDDEPQSATRDDAARAATILEQMQEGHATSIECLKLLLKCSDNPNKNVKTSSVKALGEMVLMKPAFLSIQKVQTVLGECLKLVNASGRVSICNVLATFLSSEPALTENFVHYFKDLLNDDAFTVRRTAVNAVGSICSADYFHGMESLATKILLMLHDPEMNVTSAVLDFFSKVFVERVDHLGCLVEINVQASIRNIMVPILKQLCQCGKDNFISLSLLVEAVVLYLKTNSDNKKKLAAAVVLESLAQVCPASLKNQFPDILKLSFCDDNEPYLLKKFFSVLISLSAFINEDGKAFICQSVKKIISGNLNWNKLSPCFLKMLMVLEKFSSDNMFDLRVRPSLDFLIQNRHDDSGRCDIQISLSIVAFLWKDYENDQNVVNLLLDFLRKPSYQMTVLSALAEARLERPLEKADPVLNGLINDFIRDTNKPHMVIAGLKYLNSCLKGDEAKYEKPEMKQLGDSSTASLSQLMQETLQAVLACTLNAHLGIRRSACGVICQIFQSGLLLRSHFTSYLMAMTTDDCSEIRNAALDSLKRMPEAELAISALDGVRVSYALRKVLHPDVMARGVANGHSVCQKAFDLIRTPPGIRKILESLVTEAAKKQRAEEVVFYLDNLVFFPFKAAKEVEHVLEALDKAIFEYRKMFHCRLMRMAKKCLDKTFKISSFNTDKIRPATIEEYLEPFICNAFEQGEESTMALLLCLEDFEFEAEPENPSSQVTPIVDEEEEKKLKGSGGKKRKKRRDSVKARKRLSSDKDKVTSHELSATDTP